MEIFLLVRAFKWLAPEFRAAFYHRDRVDCPCRLYPEHLMYDPHKEAAVGNIRIENTLYADGDWVDAYLCVCTICGTRYRVDEREYHYTGWGWKALT